jgi:peptidoglycan hydrolase-like protein with peptidoglycan-binding domain
MSWHLAPSLVQLRSEVNRRWPNRPKGSDGTVGDTSHNARKSDHNPNERGSVNAFDITYPGVDPKIVIAAVSKHPSANYVIFNKNIYSKKSNWKAVAYTGTNPHKTHLHVSIIQSASAERDTTPWLAGATVKPKPKPVKRSTFPLPAGQAFGRRATAKIHNGYRNSEDKSDVKRIQRKLGVTPVSGWFGPVTEKAVKRWQLRRLIRRTGLVGKKEWDRMGL